MAERSRDQLGSSNRSEGDEEAVDLR
jgi:hypothetical protein